MRAHNRGAKGKLLYSYLINLKKKFKVCRKYMISETSFLIDFIKTMLKGVST